MLWQVSRAWHPNHGRTEEGIQKAQYTPSLRDIPAASSGFMMQGLFITQGVLGSLGSDECLIGGLLAEVTRDFLSNGSWIGVSVMVDFGTVSGLKPVGCDYARGFNCFGVEGWGGSEPLTKFPGHDCRWHPLTTDICTPGFLATSFLVCTHICRGQCGGLRVWNLGFLLIAVACLNL